jgi:hypothetical protein
VETKSLINVLTDQRVLEGGKELVRVCEYFRLIRMGSGCVRKCCNFRRHGVLFREGIMVMVCKIMNKDWDGSSRD